MRTARLRIPTEARALSVGVSLMLVLGLGLMAPLGVIAQDSAAFDVPVDSVDSLNGITAVVANSVEGVNLRAEASHDAEIVTVLPEGTVVTLRIDQLDTVYDPDGVTRWWPVAADGSEGWVSGSYLAATDAASVADEPAEAAGETEETAAAEETADEGAEAAAALPDDTFDVDVASVDSLTGLTAQVASADGVNVRAEPGTAGDIVATAPNGAIVELRIDAVDTVYDEADNRWWPVSFDGQEGWIVGAYLAATDAAPPAAAAEDTTTDSEETDGAAGDDASEDVPADTFDISGAESLSGLTALVSSADGVNLRAEPNDAAEILLAVPGGEIVELRVDVADTVYDEAGNRWWPVRYDGSEGWIVGTYLADSGVTAAATASTASSSVSGEATSATAAFVAGDYVAAQTVSGQGVNIRDGAGLDAERVGYIPESGVVQVVEGPVLDDAGVGWYLITNGDVTGYADGDLLVASAAPEPAAPEVTLEPAQFSGGEYALAATPGGVGVNLRAEATTGSDLLGGLAEQTVVYILDGPYHDARGNDWYQVESGDLVGFVAGDLMNKTEAPAPEQPQPVSGPTGTFISPLSGAAFTQSYGCSPFGFEPFNAAIGCNFHNGIDLALPAGTPIVAADGGTVAAAGWCDCGLGFYVTIDHGNGFRTTYGHLMGQPWVAAGQQVNQGQQIGPVGSTGLSTGPHVHFMVELNGTTVDPLGYVAI